MRILPVAVSIAVGSVVRAQLVGRIGTRAVVRLTSAPATESILSVLPPAKAGIGSAVNDATREAGGTLGVAVIGSVFTSTYLHRLAHTPIADLPARALVTPRHSVGGALSVAQHTPGVAGRARLGGVTRSFMSGLHVGCIVAAAVCWAGAGAAPALPGRRPTGTLRLQEQATSIENEGARW